MADRERIVYLACLAVGLAGWVCCAAMLAKVQPRPKKPAQPPVVVTVCSGCGAEWESYDGQAEPITKCPNCPMSEEEWEALKESIRKRRDGIGS